MITESIRMHQKYLHPPNSQTVGRLQYALLFLGYILVGIQLEEATIALRAGPSYDTYRQGPHTKSWTVHCSAAAFL
jgi:hypothetical protein